jgi:AraC-like DNA-binding protein
MKFMTKEDEGFLANVLAAVEKHFADKQFNTETLAQETAISRAELNKRLQVLLGQDSRQFILAVRLRRAAELLREDTATVSAVASRVGFRSASYFTRCFKKRFGCLPSDYGTTERREIK